MAAIVKKKHHSRKLKSSWRKHVNIDDVDNFLEEQRLNERIGTIDAKSDAELFSVDKKAAKFTALTSKQRQKLLASKPPKCLAALVNHSKVEDPIKKRNRVRTPEERKHFLIKLKEEEKNKLGILSKVEQKALEQKLETYKNKRNCKRKNDDFVKDIWAEEDIPKEFQNEWYNKVLVEHNMKNTGRPLVKIPNVTHHKPSQLKPISVPHPGTSYNPTVDDHEKIVNKAIEVEEKKMVEEEHLARVTENMFPKRTPEERRQMQLEQMVEGFPVDGVQSTDDEENGSGDDEYKSVNPPVRNKKKDKKARRKQREERIKRAKLEAEKHEVKKLMDITKVPKFETEIKKVDAQLTERKKRHVKELKDKKYEARRLGRVKFVEPEIHFNNAIEISGNLRNLKQEGSLMVDRYKSLQKRNILAPNKVRKIKKRLVKKYTKKQFKEVIQVQQNGKKIIPT